MTRPLAVICDLDGTLCLLNGRDPYKPELCHTDEVNPTVLGVIGALHDWFGWVPIFLTGRNDGAREATRTWLRRYDLSDHRLIMRPHPSEHSWTPAPVWKRWAYENLIAPHRDVRLVLEDDPRVATMFRNLGVPCFLVDERVHIEIDEKEPA